MFRVETPQFSGTLADLVECIQQDSIDIFDISLSEITAAFVRHLQDTSLPIIDTIGIHLHVSQLLLLKVQYMLNKKEEVDTTHLKREIIDILIEFQRLKRLADELEKLQLDDARQIARKNKMSLVISRRTQHQLRVADALFSTTMHDATRNPQELATYLHRILAKMTVIRSLPKFSQFSLSLMQQRLIERVEDNEICLSHLVDENHERRPQLISAVLAVLIAIKQQIVIATQKRPFQTVLICKKIT